MIIKSPSPNFDTRKKPIKYIVLHYTGMNNQEMARELLCDAAPNYEKYASSIAPIENDIAPTLNPVSAHYLIYSDGQIFQLVEEQNRAWHAGAGCYDNETDMNSASIGIEIHNKGHDFGLPPFKDAQINSLIGLLKQIVARHNIQKQNIIGHSDLAPLRKLDPGEHFPWHILENANLAASIPIDEINDENISIIASQIGEANDLISCAQAGLIKIGYCLEENSIFDAKTKAVLSAFQMRFRQSDVKGNLDIDTFEKIKRLQNNIK